MTFVTKQLQTIDQRIKFNYHDILNLVENNTVNRFSSSDTVFYQSHVKTVNSPK